MTNFAITRKMQIIKNNNYEKNSNFNGTFAYFDLFPGSN